MTTRQENLRPAHALMKAFTDEPFTSVSSNEWYGVEEDDNDTRANRLVAKAKFIDDTSQSFPELTYPKLEALNYDKVERTYQSLLAEAQELNDETESDLIYEQVARKLAELYRHKEVIRRIGWTANYALSRERAGTMTIELFGSPDTDDFSHVLGSLRKKAERLKGQSTIAQELLELTGEMNPETSQPSFELAESTIEVLRSDMYKIFPRLETALADVPADDATREEKFEFMQDIATTVTGLQRPIRMTEGAKSAETHASTEEVTIGAERIDKMSGSQPVKIAVHESIGHLVRAVNAKKQSDAALREVQAGNLAFEEGFATAIEQIITGETRIAGMQYYLSLGLQMGIDRDGEPRDFRETFEIMWRRIVVEDSIAGKQADEAEARQKAYLQCMRTMRGGALDARDISYFDGAKIVSPWLNSLAKLPEADRIQVLKTVLSGRFDATNDEQMKRFQAGIVG